MVGKKRKNFTKSTALITLSFFLIILFQNCTGGFDAKSKENMSLTSISREACEDELTNFYSSNVKPMLTQSSCLNCHSSDGLAKDTNFAFNNTFSDKEETLVLLNLINHKSPLESLLLKKPSGEISHFGGNLVSTGSTEYATLSKFINLASEKNFCDTTSSAKSCEDPKSSIFKKKLRLLSADQLLAIQNRAKRTNKGNPISGGLVSHELENPSFGFIRNADRNTLEANTFKSYFKTITKVIDSRYKNMDSLIGQCIEGKVSDVQCVNQIIDTFSLSYLRRPLPGEDKKDLISTLNLLVNNGVFVNLTTEPTIAHKIKFIFKYLLNHPLFFYQTEIGLTSTQDEDGTVTLDNYEIASYLSYLIWGDAPDDELLEKASMGLLQSKSVLKSQVARMVKSQKSKDHLKEFFHEYLKTTNLKTMSNTKFSDFNKLNVRASLIENIDLFYDYYLDVENLNYLNLMSASEFPIQRNAALAYGYTKEENLTFPTIADVKSGLSTPTFVSFPGERYGVLTHPAYLSSHSNDFTSGIIKRGVFLLEQVLCYDIPVAPADTTTDESLLEGFDISTLTTRRRLEISHSSQATCISCHQSIDNAGGAFENFDKIGQFRLTENLSKNELSIDASGVLDISTPTGHERLNISYNNSLEFVSNVVESNYFNHCVQRRLLEYLTGVEKSMLNYCAFEKQINTDSPYEMGSFQNFVERHISSENLLLRKEEPEND